MNPDNFIGHAGLAVGAILIYIGAANSGSDSILLFIGGGMLYISGIYRGHYETTQ